ncbi:MAG: daunorubicin ABC transporter ATP-binding protein [Candidatus Diapherotrites archaeon]|uniref:Daunorubicin ABC transporter ATP-binding protein n=1 Tax=Candidatus Iainarchaeum sp. TaxID=3101447 RepID=A0A2D6LZX1_9ARCH|nr:daunorubicin ABC transporter ATP-binding protein [Candidatus Diapherotrites archaeon]
MAKIVEARNLVKSFKIKENSGKLIKDFFYPSQQSFRALDDVSLSIEEGETLGLLGPNGAGKTTFTKCLCGLISPDEGQITIDSRPVGESANNIGVTLGYHLVYHRLTGYDNLKFFAKLYKVKNYKERIKELSEFFELDKRIHNFVENYSLGMKAKLALARALIHNPDVLLLDEPTLGLDPRISATIRSEIKAMKKTILLTTHYMPEAQELCDRIAIINKGSIIVVDTPEKLKKMVEKHTIVEVNLQELNGSLKNELNEQNFVHGVSSYRDRLRIIIDRKSDLPELLLMLSKHNITKVDEYEPTLEDVFLKLVGE